MSTSLLTLAGDRVTIDDEELAALRQQLRGDLLSPADEGYDEARAVQNGMFDRRPGLIIRCSGTADVIDAVGLAREHDLLVAVRCGGHSIAGHSVCDDGLLIDLSPMRAVAVDERTRRVRVQGGSTWGDVDRETQAFGLAVPGGIVSTTGVAGLTLGGGIGWLHRKLGLACDSLRAAEMVTADGRLVRTSDTEDPELLWGLRGGGGNFGVVTAFEFEAHPVGPTVFMAAPVYDAAHADTVFPRWVEWARSAPDEVTSRANFWWLPPAPALPPAIQDQDVLILGALYAGPVDEGERVLQPLRELGEPLADLSMAMPYRTAQSNFDPFFVKGAMRSYWKATYLDGVDDAAMELTLRSARERPHPLCMVHVALMGGATSRVSPERTAFGDRAPDFMLSVDGNWTEPADDEACLAWVRSVIAEAEQLPTAGGTYLNFSGDDEIDQRSRTAQFGENLERLTALKDRFDPRNRFRLNNNVPPSGAVGRVPGPRPAEAEAAREAPTGAG
jgi:FAD/FMN-containing dehydrogenase